MNSFFGHLFTWGHAQTGELDWWAARHQLPPKMPSNLVIAIQGGCFEWLFVISFGVGKGSHL